MSADLADLIISLQDDVPAIDGTPNYDQARRFVIESVADFSRRVGRVKSATLSIVSGTETYDLPNDCMRIVYMQPLGELTVTDGSRPSSESWFVQDVQITLQDSFGDPPAYSCARKYRYQAGFYLDPVTETYADLGPEESGIVLLLAASKALISQANISSGQDWEYTLADEKVSKRGLGKALVDQASTNRAEYLSRVKGYIGALFSEYRNSGGSQDAYQWRLDPDAI